MGVRNLRGSKLKIKRGLVLKKEKVYVLKDEKLKIEIIWLHHNVPITEYGGR